MIPDIEDEREVKEVLRIILTAVKEAVNASSPQEMDAAVDRLYEAVKGD